MFAQGRQIVLALVIIYLGCSPEPDFKNLSSQVEVRRDEWGTPHVYGKDQSDVLFVLGYETARDRLFQLDLLRRRALGATAELLGPDYAGDDRIARTLGFGQLGVAAEADLRAHDPEVHRTLSAYAAGISAYISDANAGKNGAVLPPEFADIDPAYRPAPWQVTDTLAMLKAELFLLAAHPESELIWYAISAQGNDGQAIANDIYRPDPLEKVYVTPGFPAHSAKRPPMQKPGKAQGTPSAWMQLSSAFAHFSGRKRVGPIGASNNWALCPRATKNGTTMLANDPHLGLDLPGDLYEIHFESDTAKGAGFGIPGLPALVNGHNGSFAWGVTTVEADDADTYLELTQGDAVSFNGQWVKMEVRTETLKVRGAPDEQLTIRVVPHHGPVISDAVSDVKLLLGEKALSLKWPGFGITHESRAFYELFRAKTTQDVQKALTHFEAGLLNFVYAGTNGDIGYLPHSIYPIRAKLDPAFPPYGVLPGTGKYEWTGEQIPDAEIPQLLNPESCRIFTANNDPAGVSDDGDVLNDTYYLGGTFDYGLRAKRIGDRLAMIPMGTATLDDLESIQGDVHDGLAEHFVPPLLEAVNGKPLSPKAAALVPILTGWNREDDADLVAPTVFNAWYAQLIADVFADDLPLAFSLAATDDRGFSSLLARLLHGETAKSGHDYLGKPPSDAMVTALEETAAALSMTLGDDQTKWRWGLVHTNTFNHPLGGRYDLGPVGLGGGMSTINCARYPPVVDGAPVIGGDVWEGPNDRVLVELGKSGVTMRGVLPTGESGIVGDPHYSDQLELWTKAKTREAHFDRADVVAHAPQAKLFPSGFPTKGAPK